MRILRTVAAALGAAAVLIASTPAHAVLLIEGESASAWTTGCGDGGDPAMGPRDHGTTKTLFFPSGGCEATYTGHTGYVTSARFALSGIGSQQCGTITVSGVGSAGAYVCVQPDTFTTVSFGTGVQVGSSGFTVSWDPDNFIVNLWLDYLVIAGL